LRWKNKKERKNKNEVGTRRRTSFSHRGKPKIFLCIWINCFSRARNECQGRVFKPSCLHRALGKLSCEIFLAGLVIDQHDQRRFIIFFSSEIKSRVYLINYQNYKGTYPAISSWNARQKLYDEVESVIFNDTGK
jgi:hypothetical protein